MNLCAGITSGSSDPGKMGDIFWTQLISQIISANLKQIGGKMTEYVADRTEDKLLRLVATYLDKYLS